MNLKKLREVAAWRQLNESDFKSKTTNCIILHESEIEKLGGMIEQLSEEVHNLKRQIAILNAQNVRLNKTVKYNQRSDDDINAEQKRNNEPVSRSHQ